MKRFTHVVLLIVQLFLFGSGSAESQERVPHAHEGMVDNFTVEVWVDRGEASVYYPGERLRVYFKPSHDCFVVVYGIDTEGYLRILYPYGYDDNPFVYGGRTRRVPDAWDHHDLLVSGPSGSTQILVSFPYLFTRSRTSCSMLSVGFRSACSTLCPSSLLNRYTSHFAWIMAWK